MSTAVLDIQAEIARERERIRKTISAPSGNGISTKGRQFALPGGQKDGGPMTVVILGYVTKNMFYVGKFDRNNPAPPVCFAIGEEIDTMVPSPNSPDKQAEDCTTCPMNQWGAPGQPKECKNTRLLAVVAPNGDENSPIMTLSVPPKSLKDFDKFVDTVDGKYNTVPAGVTTEISFDDSVDFEKLLFKVSGPNENLTAHWGRKAEALRILMVEPNLSRASTAPAKPAVAARPVAATRPAAVRGKAKAV